MRRKVGEWCGFVFMAIFVAAGVVTLQSAFALERATKEQMAAHARDADKLWSAPGTNYAAIYAYLIEPGVISRDEVLRRVKPVLAKAEGAQERAALNYLMGEACYCGGLADVLKSKDRAALMGVGESVVAAFLAAWEAILDAEQSPNAARLRRTITVRFNQLLGSAICGSNLSAELKREVVTRYVDQLLPEEQADTVFPLVLRGRVFANLGILSRMANSVPTTMPTNFFGVCEAMNLAWRARATNETLRFASALEKTYGRDLAKWPDKHREVFAIYRACGDERAWPCIHALATNDPTARLELYDFAVHAEPRTSLEQRRKYMDSYLEGVEAKSGKSLATYRMALERLIANGDYELAIQLADQAFRDKGIPRYRDQAAYVWRLKAIAHKRRGEVEQAIAAYRNGLEKASSIEQEEIRDLFKREMNELNDHAKDKETAHAGRNK